MTRWALREKQPNILQSCRKRTWFVGFTQSLLVLKPEGPSESSVECPDTRASSESSQYLQSWCSPRLENCQGSILSSVKSGLSSAYLPWALHKDQHRKVCNKFLCSNVIHKGTQSLPVKHTRWKHNLVAERLGLTTKNYLGTCEKEKPGKKE